jgi:flagellar FliJ protein
MKSRETLIRLKKFQVDEKRRRVAQIEGMIADFQRMSVDLEREIQMSRSAPASTIPRTSPIRPMPRPRSSAART